MKQKAKTTVVVGSGIVGMTMALKLAHNKHQVILVDPRPVRSEDDWQKKLAKKDTRVFALNNASIRLLKAIGVWKYIEQQNRKIDYSKMYVWQTNGFGKLDFSKQEINQVTNIDNNQTDIDSTQNIGSIIEPSVIEYALEKRILEEDVAAYIQKLNNHKVLNIYDCIQQETKSNAHIVELNNGKKITADLLIGADGRFSTVRHIAGIGLDTLDYSQTAICCAVKTEKQHGFTARQAMLPTGTLALLPLAVKNSNNWQSIVWTLPTAKAAALIEKSNDDIASELAFASSYELGNIEKIESISSFPLIAQQAKTYIKAKLVLIGDSAHGIHPLAGQGLNLGLSDVESLARFLDKDNKRMLALNIADNWGCWQTLQKYERDRKAKNSQMMHGCSILNWTFAGQFSQIPCFQQARSEGMAFVNKQRWLVDWFNKQASGL